jgi:hypothetical protein
VIFRPFRTARGVLVAVDSLFGEQLTNVMVQIETSCYWDHPHPYRLLFRPSGVDSRHTVPMAMTADPGILAEG